MKKNPLTSSLILLVSSLIEGGLGFKIRRKRIWNFRSPLFIETILLLLLLMSGCSENSYAASHASGNPSSAPGSPTVFAAASLTEAFTQIGRRFESAHPGAKVVFNFAGSQQLAQQIVQGAPADVFASADQQQMAVAIQSKLVARQSVQEFTNNRLVVIYPAGNPAHIHTLQDLTKPGLKLDLAANAVPVGLYSLKFLDQANQDPALGPDYKQAVLKNVVSYEENVRAVLSKVILGEADAGIVYTSDISKANAAKVGELNIPDNLNVIASYYIAPTSDTANPALAGEFVAFVLSPTGQKILSEYGFLPVK